MFLLAQFDIMQLIELLYRLFWI